MIAWSAFEVTLPPAHARNLYEVCLLSKEAAVHGRVAGRICALHSLPLRCWRGLSLKAGHALTTLLCALQIVAHRFKVARLDMTISSHVYRSHRYTATRACIGGSESQIPPTSQWHLVMHTSLHYHRSAISTARPRFRVHPYQSQIRLRALEQSCRSLRPHNGRTRLQDLLELCEH